MITYVCKGAWGSPAPHLFAVVDLRHGCRQRALEVLTGPKTPNPIGAYVLSLARHTDTPRIAGLGVSSHPFPEAHRWKDRLGCSFAGPAKNESNHCARKHLDTVFAQCR